MHILGQPVAQDEPITREGLLFFRKLSGKGRIEEIKIVTDWEIDARRFTVSLKDNKLTTYHIKMEMLKGRINQCGFITRLLLLSMPE